MELNRVKESVMATVFCHEELLDTEIFSACGCDLMSDVLAFAAEKILLLTGLVNLQVIRTAEMLDIKAILFVRGKKPTEEMIAFANEREIILMSTSYPLFVACGILYEAGLKGKGELKDAFNV